MRDIWIQFGSKKYSRGWLESHPDVAQRIFQRQKNGHYPYCMCRRPYPKLYIAKRHRFYLARMPGTGMQHAHDCPEYEPEHLYDGYNEQKNFAITENGEGIHTVKLGVPLNYATTKGKKSAHALPRKSRAKNDTKNVPLMSLLRLLWRKAQFNRWTPRMKGHRRYPQLYKYLSLAAETIYFNKHTFSEQLYIPEPFFVKNADAIRKRANERIGTLLMLDGVPRRMLVVGLLKKIVLSHKAAEIYLAHAPGNISFGIEREHGIQLDAFSREMPSDDYLVTIMTVEKEGEGKLRVDKFSSMRVNANYIPYTSREDRIITNALIDNDRLFIKALNYGERTSVINHLLLDTGQNDDPVSMIVIGEMSGKYDQAKKEVIENLQRNNKRVWLWNTKTNSFPPTFPGKSATPNPERAMI